MIQSGTLHKRLVPEPGPANLVVANESRIAMINLDLIYTNQPISSYREKYALSREYK